MNNYLIEITSMGSLKARWKTFYYNYRWSNYVTYIDGWIPKLALSVPILGYLILFNDDISQMLEFKELANEDSLNFGLDSLHRLRFLYFGLILLGISNLIYKINKPKQFKFGTNILDYTRNGLEIFTISDYNSIYDIIQDKGHKTTYGKINDETWDSFVKFSEHSIDDPSGNDFDWERGKSKFGGFLRRMLQEFFFQSDTKKRIWLTLCISLSTIGYFFLFIPSADLFIKVVVSVTGFST